MISKGYTLFLVLILCIRYYVCVMYRYYRTGFNCDGLITANCESV